MTKEEQGSRQGAQATIADACPKPDQVPDSDCHFQTNSTSPKALEVLPAQTNGESRHFIKFADRQWWINFHWHNPDNSWDPDRFKGTYDYGKDGQYNSDFDPKRFYTTNADGSVTLKAFQKPASDPYKGVVTSEIVMKDKIGYGKFLVTARADNGTFATLDPYAILGIFTYQYANAAVPGLQNVNRELDLLETISTIAQPDRKTGNAQFAIQPARDNQTIKRMEIPSDCKFITVLMEWKEEEISGISVPLARFEIYNGDFTEADLVNNPGKQFATWAYIDNSGIYVPKYTKESCVRFHINFWLWKGTAPKSPQAVTITRFQYTPQ
ncbi:MAG TPA: hypothetical protein V6C97_21890 [Oculatellaceae cyanobacterium]